MTWGSYIGARLGALIAAGWVCAASLEASDAPVPTLLAEKGAEGTILSGEVSAETTLLLPDSVKTSDLIEPSASFDGATLRGLAALAALAEGEMRVAGPEVTLSGSGTRLQIAAAIDTLETLPEGVSARTSLSPIDDGLPLGFTATKVGETVTMVGKMPFGTQPEALGLASFEEAMLVSEVDARAPAFLEVSQAGLRALAALHSGRLVVSDAADAGAPAELRIEGDVTRAGLASINAALGGLPRGVKPVIDVVFFDDGTPFRLRAALRDGGLTLSGKVPFGTDADDLGVARLGPHVELAELRARNDAFIPESRRGLDALRALESGVFTIRNRATEGEPPRQTLFGVARFPSDADAIARSLDRTVRLNLTVLDDGTPPAFTLRFAAQDGLALSGKLPSGLTEDGIGQKLGVEAVESSATKGLTGDAAEYDPAFRGLAAWLPEIERATVEFDGAGLASLRVVPEPGVDPDLLASGLAQSLGVMPELGFAKLPKQGAERVGAVTGRVERFSGKAWLPVYAFVPSLERCDARSSDVLRAGDLTFVSGSARLDARAVRAINQLAGLIIHCRSGLPSLRVEVGGHTDARGSEDSNLALSIDRAEAVATALVARGVAAEAVRAKGFGEAKPIAPNDSAAGRAENRRIETTWSNSATSP